MVHTLLQANGTPGLQMLESNVMVQLPPGAETQRHGHGGRVTAILPRHPLGSLPFRGKEGNGK